MLSSHRGYPKTFLIPPGRLDGAESLAEYEHPTDAIYVFGSVGESLVDHVGRHDDVVSICTPRDAVLFGHVALAAVLYDRAVKS